MSSTNSIFSSVITEERWVEEMSRTFPREHVVDVDFDLPPCVFRVPRSLTETKPEAYAPQEVGLGPYHHLRPDLYKMQRKKLAAVTKFLNAEQLQNFQLVVELFMRLEPFVRASYDLYLDLAPVTLAWIVAIDAIYLLQFLAKYQDTRSGQVTTQNPEMEKLAGDILMLENQIPTIFLIATQKILKLSPDAGDPHKLANEFWSFGGQVSPLELNSLGCTGHLLSTMYHSILSDRMHLEVFFIPFKTLMESTHVKPEDVANAVASLGLPGAQILQQALSLMAKVPWDKILDLLKRGDPDREENLLVEEIRIPSVSQLTEIAGIRFALIQGGIRDVKFDEEEKKFHLPALTIRSNSEVILRNLMAYEAASVEPGSTLVLAEYVDLMCGIVDTPNDVDILRKEKIITSDLTDAEIATIFNGIRKSTGDEDKKTTDIEKAIGKVNELYATIPKVKVYRSIKKHIPSLRKFVTVLSVIVVLGLFVVQAFCEIHGCKKH